MTKEYFCKGIIVQAPKKYMDDKLMEDWLGCVWQHRPGALSEPWSMLAMDALHGRIRNRLRNKITNVVIIPSGMTNQLQPFDLSLDKPFRHHP
jgi:hypothetical protein